MYLVFEGEGRERGKILKVKNRILIQRKRKMFELWLCRCSFLRIGAKIGRISLSLFAVSSGVYQWIGFLFGGNNITVDKDQ